MDKITIRTPDVTGHTEQVLMYQDAVNFVDEKRSKGFLCVQVYENGSREQILPGMKITAATVECFPPIVGG
jgi:hypothetical protein